MYYMYDTLPTGSHSSHFSLLYTHSFIILLYNVSQNRHAVTRDATPAPAFSYATPTPTPMDS